MEELAQASAAAVPARVYTSLGTLLQDKVLEVRISALHAAKTLCKLRPALLRASDGRACAHLLPGVLACLADKRNVMVGSAAKRTLMHLAIACGWSASIGPTTPKEASEVVVEFCRKHLSKLAGQESEAEHSDEEPV